MSDKIERAINVRGKSIHVRDEGLRDTLIDLANYSKMAVMLIDNAGDDDRPEEFPS